MSKAYEELQNLVGKDMGDFGGWDGLREYCKKWYGDDMEVLSLIYQMESEAQQTFMHLALIPEQH